MVASLMFAIDSRADDTLEYAIKATFLYKFALFVQWPSDIAEISSRPLTVCLSGSDGVTAVAPEAASGQNINGGPVVVTHLSPGAPLDACKILYVANAPGAAELLDAARGKPILTVTDGGGARHGIIQFVLVDRHVRFDIDEQLAAESRIRISSQLLQLARRVIPRNGSAAP